MVSLLKQKAKITIHRKERTKYDLADVFKKRKLNDGDLASSLLQPQGSEEEKINSKEKKKIVPQILS